MKLFLLRGCPFAHRATIVLQEKKLDFEPVFFARGKRPAELEVASPYAKSPTLFDGDATVWDAQIVIEYLQRSLSRAIAHASRALPARRGSYARFARIAGARFAGGNHRDGDLFTSRSAIRRRSTRHNVAFSRC